MTTTSPAPSQAWRRRALLVPLLAAGAAGLLVARGAWDSDTFQHCRYLGPSTRMYVASWAGLVCALGSVVVHTALMRAAYRPGVAIRTTWQYVLAMVSAIFGWLLVLALLASVYWLYAPDPSGGFGCEGLAYLSAP